MTRREPYRVPKWAARYWFTMLAISSAVTVTAIWSHWWLGAVFYGSLGFMWFRRLREEYAREARDGLEAMW